MYQRVCNNKINMWVPDRTNIATLEFEPGHFVDRTCGATNYSGNMQLCDTCQTNYKPTIEWEADSPSWEDY